MRSTCACGVGSEADLGGRVCPELSAAECSGGGTDEGEGNASQHTVSSGSVHAVGCLEMKGSGGMPAADMTMSACNLLLVRLFVYRCRGLLVYSVMSSFRPEYIASR